MRIYLADLVCLSMFFIELLNIQIMGIIRMKAEVACFLEGNVIFDVGIMLVYGDFVLFID